MCDQTASALKLISQSKCKDMSLVISSVCSTSVWCISPADITEPPAALKCFIEAIIYGSRLLFIFQSRDISEVPRLQCLSKHLSTRAIQWTLNSCDENSFDSNLFHFDEGKRFLNFQHVLTMNSVNNATKKKLCS